MPVCLRAVWSAPYTKKRTDNLARVVGAYWARLPRSRQCEGVKDMTIDFSSIRGLEQWVSVFPEQFEPLAQSQRRLLANALANGVHEGWKPTKVEVQLLADQVVGARPRLSINDLMSLY